MDPDTATADTGVAPDAAPLLQCAAHVAVTTQHGFFQFTAGLQGVDGALRVARQLFQWRDGRMAPPPYHPHDDENCSAQQQPDRQAGGCTSEPSLVAPTG